MPNVDWQLIAALVAVLAAAGFLVRRGVMMLRSGTKSNPACGSCGSCATGSDATGKPSTAFVPLESLVQKGK